MQPKQIRAFSDLLIKWENIQKDHLRKECTLKKTKIREEDKLQILSKKLLDELNAEIHKEYPRRYRYDICSCMRYNLNYDINPECITPETEKKIAEIDYELNEKLVRLRSYCSLVSTVIEPALQAGTYEDVVKLLKVYNILNKDGTLNTEKIDIDTLKGE